MAARNFTEMQLTMVRGLRTLFGKGPGNGTGNITLTHGLGMSPTLTRTGAGAYTITLTDKYNHLLNFLANVVDPTTPDDWTVNMVAETVASTKTVTIACYKGGVAADLSSDETLMFQVVMSDHSGLPVKGS